MLSLDEPTYHTRLYVTPNWQFAQNAHKLYETTRTQTVFQRLGRHISDPTQTFTGLKSTPPLALWVKCGGTSIPHDEMRYHQGFRNLWQQGKQRQEYATRSEAQPRYALPGGCTFSLGAT